MKDITERFWSKVQRGGPDECWPWIAGTSHRGYGAFYLDHGMHQSHRVSWELTHGPITDGLHVLHTCDNPPCVNPAHLFLGTDRDNARDSVAKGHGLQRGAAAFRLTTTHCPQGHPYTPENTALNYRGHRECRACRQARRRVQYQKERTRKSPGSTRSVPSRA